ncbi:hypothetical protein P154DRAFT_487968 [Amniculicola lignicola CBS 123094]|uniref:DUF7905 domain-containing protein n=1 Tax=Amniculicola lignicola CBS 123094 TaxID=1392246 RepID=A0A6A5WZH7_9PLEO|nr:hypothetical protein P154DRAFT_487968 [Amniculicola lignicola CBS 123094]
MSGYGRGGGPRKPNRVLRVPPEMRPRHILVDLQRVASQEWKAETNAEIVPVFEMGRLVQFNLYGSAANLDAAVKLVNKWLEAALTKTAPSTAWAKMKAFDPNEWQFDTVRSLENNRKQKFKEPIPKDQVGLIPFRRLVDWPTELLELDPKVTPRDAFGNKLEVLDQIRTEEEVYITLLPNHAALWQVELQGYELARIDAAEMRYVNLIQKVYQKSISGDDNAITNIILDETEGLQVALTVADDWWPSRVIKVVPRLIYSPVMNEPGSFRKDGLHHAQIRVIREAIRRSLEKVRFEKGSYEFSIRFGCLALKGLPEEEMGKAYPLTSFRKATDSGSAVECHVTKWLQPSDLGEQMQDRLMNADHVLEPVKSVEGFFGYTPATLKDTKPTYRGTFVLHDPDKSHIHRSSTAPRNPGRPTPPPGSNAMQQQKPLELNLIVVQIDWTEDEDGMYEKMAPRFFKLKTGQSGAMAHMDINLLELGESKAWSFTLESMIPVRKLTLSPVIVGFADSVKMKPGYKPESNEPFATYNRTPSVKFQFFRLDRVYTFGICKTLYRVEAKAMWYPGQTIPCWGLVIRHTEWGMHLSPLEKLSPGNGANFGSDSIKTFIPDGGVSSSHALDDTELEDQLEQIQLENTSLDDGMVILIEKLLQLSEIVKGDNNHQDEV